MSRDVVILFALEREAAPFRWVSRGIPHVRIQVSGVGRARARQAAEQLLHQHPTPGLVVAAGFCGALIPDLRVGDIVTENRLVTVHQLVADPQTKRELAVRSGAQAVDMESAAIGEVCARFGVPFRAIRAVSDTADTALSPELVHLLSGGSVSPLRAALALVRKPSLLGEFRRLARDTRLAGRNLAEALVRVATPQAA